MQQINLYRPARTKSSFDLNAKQMGAIFLCGIIVMTGCSSWQWFQLRHLQTSVAHLTDKKSDAEVALAEVKAKHISPAADKSLEALLLQHERLLAGKKALVQLITELPSGATAGFSRYLEALGTQYVKGLWLKKLEFKDGGRTINLFGGMQSAELVPDYLKKLSVESAFQGKNFAGLKLEKDEAGRNSSFAITTQPLIESEDKTQ